MSSESICRPALGPLSNAVNARVGQAPIAKYSTSTGRENAPVALSSAKPAATKKRKSTEEHVPTTPVDLHSINLEDAEMDENCDQVRRKINRLLDSGAMTKTAFAREIGVSAKSLSGFMSTSGPFNGSRFATYGAAWEFFKKREMAGVKLPVKRAKTAAGGVGGQGGATHSATVDISGIVLPGEDEDAVPVFDTCDEVRKKIGAHLIKSGVTKAQFCRDVYAQLKGPCRPGKSFQGGQLDRFRNAKGPISGVSSSFFYGAYVFFEKMRIKEGKPKSKHRSEMEGVWGAGGIDREHDGRSAIICHVDDRPYVDQYGRIRF